MQPESVTRDPFSPSPLDATAGDIPSFCYYNAAAAAWIADDGMGSVEALDASEQLSAMSDLSVRTATAVIRRQTTDARLYNVIM